MAEETAPQGIAKTFANWEACGKKKEKRLSFYLSVIDNAIRAMEGKINASLVGVPLLISGMASSALGMMELPYKSLPFSLNGADLIIEDIHSAGFAHPVWLISGARTQKDVLRGEETLLIGCSYPLSTKASLFIFPGTHSKHMMVSHGKAVAFKTFMTGELFELLSGKSILALSVEKGGKIEDPQNEKFFKEGVLAGAQNTLLHSCFLVRTNHLFGTATKTENYYYLSGLLIGSEVKEAGADVENITIVGNSVQNRLYALAFQTLHAEHKPVQLQSSREAFVNGQIKIYENIASANR